MIILVDLANSFADLEMSLEIIHPVALGAVDGDTAIGTFKVRMGGGLIGLGFPCFRIMWRDRRTGLLVTWVWAESVLLDECSALPDGGRGRIREGVEEVVRFQEGSRIDGGTRRSGNSPWCK